MARPSFVPDARRHGLVRRGLACSLNHTCPSLRPYTIPCETPQYGEDAIKEGMGGGGGGGGSMADLFGELFGGGRGGGRARERRSEDVVHKLAVALEDLYTGTVK